jgi:thermitase
LIFATTLSLLALGNPTAELRLHPSPRLLVEPRPGATATEIEALHRSLGAHLIRDLPQIGWQIVEVDPARIDEVRRAYASSAVVARVEPDREYRLAHIPNDPMWPGMWNLQHIHCDTAWDVTRGSSSVKVAVIDTGLETTHPDIAANVWTNPGEVPGNGIDDDNDGYVDDVHGWDFVNNDPVPDDLFGHGTCCSGIIAAVQDNNLGVTGIAPLVQIVPLKACNDAGYLYDSYVVPALLYAADHGCQVISMSFYGDQVTPSEAAAIDYCWAHGCLPVAAAGNDSQVFPYYPGAYELTLAVGAHDSSDHRSWFSNFGSWVDVAAPGEGISTTTTGGGYTTGFAGTSGACPHVAGIAALLFSEVPTATNAQVRAAIEDSAIFTNGGGTGEWTNYGRVDARAALDRLAGSTSGSKPARFLYASPVGGGRNLYLFGRVGTPPAVVLYGVGLELPNVVRVLRNGASLPLISQERNEVRFNIGSNADSTLDLEVNGQIVQSLAWDGSNDWIFSPSDADTKAPAASTGGFSELYRDDGSRFTSTADPGAGQIFVQLSLLKVRYDPIRSMSFAWTRSYTHSTGGTETVQVYDWSTWSYPYGTWVTAATVPINGSGEEHHEVVLPANPTRFLDDQGTMYVQIYAAPVASNALLSMDSFRLIVH